MLHIGVQYSHAVADDDVTIGLGIEMVLFGSKIENRFRIALASCVCVSAIVGAFRVGFIENLFCETDGKNHRTGREKGAQTWGSGTVSSHSLRGDHFVYCSSLMLLLLLLVVLQLKPGQKAAALLFCLGPRRGISMLYIMYARLYIYKADIYIKLN